jgi:hypothetical protein
MVDGQNGNVGHSNLHKTTQIHILKSLKVSLIDMCMDFSVTDDATYCF